MLPLSALSRRALVIAAAFAALAPGAEAGKHHKPPLAVASVVLVDITPSSPGVFNWAFQGAVVHTESGNQARLNSSGDITPTATTDQARKEIVSLMRFRAVEALRNQRGLEVPQGRIAVVLL